jgi:hypothetical protein
MARKSDFTPTMLAFIRWYFRTLDPKFTKELFAGKSLNQAARSVFTDITSNVRGNRKSDIMLTVTDYGAIMDRIAALHLRTRHGEEAVRQEDVPLRP